MSVTGKTVVISGASRGIGMEAARVFAEAGANVVLMARSAQDLEKLAQELGPQAMALACDVADYAAVEAGFAAAEARFGSLDVLICNAGMIEPIARLETADPATWARLIDVNVTGVFNMIRAGLPHLKATGGGCVLTVGSGASQRPLEGWSAYCTSKAGAAMLTNALHLEEAGSGIRVMSLSPGTVATQMQRDIKASGINPVSQLDWSDHIPADWPARALLWMTGPDAQEFAGTEISLREDSIRKRIGLI